MAPEDVVVVKPGGKAAFFTNGDFFQTDAAGKFGFAEVRITVFCVFLPFAGGCNEFARGVSSEAVVPVLWRGVEAVQGGDGGGGGAFLFVVAIKREADGMPQPFAFAVSRC